MPLVILIHGGGFVFGAPEVEAPFAVEIVKAYGCSVICLSYRLAPEHKFPTATEDCWDAFTWVGNHVVDVWTLREPCLRTITIDRGKSIVPGI